ncbi:hypothetical protein BGZ49_007464 [Haplosporangium sp. Z 27]|nr:hypothetical protein BGZ49_007464 [Haplosporangium sp. Z 27]
MDTPSEISLLLRIHALERALSKCKGHRMVDVYYTRPQTKPLCPTHHDSDTLQIWITSNSYVNYYQNIAYRLKGLRDLYESERLSKLGFRPPIIPQVDPELFVELEPDYDTDESDDDDDRGNDGGDEADDNSSVATTHDSVSSCHPKVSGKCPRKTPVTTTTTVTTPTPAPLMQNNHHSNTNERSTSLPDYESSEPTGSPYQIFLHQNMNGNIDIVNGSGDGGGSDTLSSGNTLAPTSPFSVLDSPGFGSPPLHHFF